MTFTDSLALIDELAALWRQFNPPASQTQPDAHLRMDVGQMHLYLWRIIEEGWTRQRCIDAFYRQHGKEPPGAVTQPPLPGVVRQGVPRGNVYQFVDDTGGWLPWGTSLFWGAYGYVFERDRIDAHLKWIAGKGIDHVRVIATGLRKGSLERSLDPKDANFQTGIAGLTDLAAQYGLRISWTIFGATYDAPSATDREKTVDKFCEALRGREQHAFLCEIANEADINGFAGESGRAELKRLVARVASKLPNLVAPTCPERGDDISPALIRPLYENTKATVQTHHYSRRTGPPDGVWRPTKKPWRETTFSVSGCAKLVTNQEPRGPESSGTETNDPLVLSTDAAVTWLSGVGAYLLHCGGGIYGVADPARGRPANLWETVNIDAICAGIKTVRALLPPDLPNWTKHRTNTPDAPFGFVDTPDEQLSFAYSASSGATIVMPVVGVTKTTVFTLRSGRCEGKVYHPVSGDVLETFDKSFTAKPSAPSTLVIAKRI